MKPRPCIIGLDEPEIRNLQERLATPILAYETAPRILVDDGNLWVEAQSRAWLVPVSAVVFHGIFDDDFDLISGLALWGGPCLPSARAMMDCRLKLPCLVRALELSEFALPRRGFVSAGVNVESEHELVAKWGNWHCGENKVRVSSPWRAEQASILEPFLPGQAVRIVVIGDDSWQIQLAGDGWLKSIHHETAAIVPADDRLVADTQRTSQGMGLAVAW